MRPLLPPRAAVWVLVAVFFLPTVASEASSLVVDRQRLRADESLRVTLTLEGELARLDAVPLPLQNLETDGPPRESSQFRWVNGVTSRQKVLVWLVRPKREGHATVGPLRLRDRGGRETLLPAIEIEVLPAIQVDSGDFDRLIRERSSDGSAIFLVADVQERKEFFEGEPVPVTWYLYSTETVRGFQIARSPALSDFWVEEIAVNDRTPAVLSIGGRTVYKVPVKRAVLFPTRTGPLTIPSLEVLVEVLRPIEDVFGLLSRFEGRLVEARRRSPEVDLAVRPLPERADAVGAFTLRCSEVTSSTSGPVSIIATVQGSGNLRAARTPSWTRSPAGTFEVADVETVVASVVPFQMRRSWQFVLFPEGDGRYLVPALQFRYFDPSRSTVGLATCGEKTTIVQTAGGGMSKPAGVTQDESTPAPGMRRFLVPAAGVSLAGLVAAALWVAMRRRTSIPEVERLMESAGDRHTLRRRLHELLAAKEVNTTALFAAPTEEGEAFRALHSLLDMLDKEPGLVDDPEKELRHRLTELFRAGGRRWGSR